MPPSKTTKKTTEDAEPVITPQQQILSYLKANKADHYNFEQDNDYQVRSSSLTVTSVMEGGVRPGAHRATGTTTGGKTSFTLDLMYHFLQRSEKRRGVYVKSEGRLSPEARARSGITFVTNPEEWVDGTCFILESNVFEHVFGFMGDLIRNNPTQTRYFFIVDSLDMMAKRDDLIKPFEQSAQVAGGAVLTSVFLKQTSLALSKRGHVCWFISQVREAVKINPYEKTPPKQGSASGGHAVEHAGDWVIEFLPRFGADLIRAGGEPNGKIIGHYCKAKIIKSNNEKYQFEIRYPIKYGRTNAQSVWVEREIIDLMLGWEMLEKSGSWLKIDEKLRTEVKEATGLELPEKVQGLDKAYALLEEPANKPITDYLFQKFLTLVAGK